MIVRKGSYFTRTLARLTINIVRLENGNSQGSKMRCLVIVMACIVIVGELTQAAVFGLHQAEWMAYKLKHGKSYASKAEDANRMANFLATEERVERHNAKSGNTYVMALNHMADWSSKERTKLNKVRSNRNSLRISEAQIAESEAYLAKIQSRSNGPIPDEWDWRQVPGRVGPVRNMGECGSDWAIAAVGVLEGQQVPRNVTKSNVIPLSIQEFIDCSQRNDGCGGGYPLNGLHDIGKFGGIESEKDYPYKHAARPSPDCKFDAKKVIMKHFDAVSLPMHDEDTLKATVAVYGPVSVRVWETENLKSYHSGVLDDDGCPPEMEYADLAMLVVGYGTDENYVDYWIVRNCWGESWGEQGYVKIKRGVNMCAIAMQPVIAKFN